jgi:hypothetical protein
MYLIITHFLFTSIYGTAAVAFNILPLNNKPIFFFFLSAIRSYEKYIQYGQAKIHDKKTGVQCLSSLLLEFRRPVQDTLPEYGQQRGYTLGQAEPCDT